MSRLGKMLGFGRNADYDRAIRQFDQGLYEEAILSFEMARNNGRQDPLTERLALFYTAEAHANLGQCAMNRGAWERAEFHFREALKIHPHYADLHFNLALALRRRLRYPEALTALEEALKINPRYAKAHFQQGIVLYASGEREQGIAAIQKAVEIEPGFATEVLQKGLQAHEEGDFAAALHAFEMVSVTDVDDLLFHYRLADDLYRRGMFGEAIEEYQKALQLNPTYPDILNRLGMAQSANGQTEEAVHSFEEALKANPDFIEARLNLGVALRNLRRFREAADAFRAVLERDPENPIACENLNELEQSLAA